MRVKIATMNVDMRLRACLCNVACGLLMLRRNCLSCLRGIDKVATKEASKYNTFRIGKCLEIKKLAVYATCVRGEGETSTLVF